MATKYWIGVDLGGTKVLAGIFDDAFQLLQRAKVPTEAARGPETVFGQIRQAVAQAMDKAGARPEQVGALGLGIPGQIDPVARRVRFAPNLNWKDLDLGPRLPREWIWPCFIENDVRLGTYGEFKHGAAKGARHVLGIFVGTGVGGGLILNGDLYTGFNFSAGEIGHIVMHWRKGTTLEGLAGRAAMMERATPFLEDAPKNVRKAWKSIDLSAVRSSQLADLFRDKDAIAVQLVDDAARALGAAVANMLNLLSPEVIVIGGGVAGALGEPFLERIWEVAQRYTLPRVAEGVRYLPAALQDDAGIYGAAAYARDRQEQTRK
jgi:glucokinase